jgi:hypothetical protein
MKRTCLAVVLASVLLGASAGVRAQAMPPPLPSLTSEQSARVQQEMDRYRRELDDRLSRGNIMPDEAQRLAAWHEWQYAQREAGLAPPGPSIARRDDVPPDYVPPPVRYAAPAYYYGPPVRYYEPAPYYLAPPLYWGPSICAGGGGRHGFARFCF